MDFDETIQEKTKRINRGNSFYPTKSSSRIADGDSSDQLRPVFKSRETINNEKLWSIMGSYLKNDVETIQQNIVNHIEYTLARTRFNFDNNGCYNATAHAIRDRLIESWNDTQQHWTNQDPKRIYYMSLEFLLGRHMQNALTNLRIEGAFKQALQDLGFKLEEIYEEEHDPALGNGGLGRLAACFLDSMATLDLPAWGYGIRYNYGIFAQKIVNGYQMEVPDYWLTYGNPWEIERVDVNYPVRFYGRTRKVTENGKEKTVWEGGEVVLAQAYDNPIPGYNTFTTINLRLWRSVPVQEFDFSLFNQADYFKAIEARQRAEYISSVLYPNDSTYSGKELRLKQQYFFVCATLQDIIRRFKKRRRTWKDFPEKVCVQLNDTHPGLAIVELLRILMDLEGLDREAAWTIVSKTFAYTNHTVLPEALEKWGVDLIGALLPRHLEIIYEINHFWLQKIEQKFPGDVSKLGPMSLIEEEHGKRVRIANLCVVGTFAVNGVAALHTELLKTTIFKDFHQLFPKKIQNKTNGVTPRRWILCCNPGLAELYTRVLGGVGWVNELDLIRQIEKKADNAEFQRVWAEIKLQNKRRLVKWVKSHCGITIDENSLFDIMVKRMHEYKRQLMNALYAIYRYFQIKNATPEERLNFVPRTIFIGGKAAPGYTTAKRVIKLINAIGEVVNNDKEVNQYLKVVFLPNYNVSNAEVIIPAAELSQHISTAGMEASGTSNMKFAMNGCLIIGTMDGANVEIAEEAGKENLFIFGALVDEVNGLRQKMTQKDPVEYAGPILNQIFRSIEDNVFGARQELVALIDTIRNRNDYYLVCHDFVDYLRAQEEVDRCYANPSEWNRRSILTAVRMAKFSSDRTIQEYAYDIWNIAACPTPQPALKKEDVFKE